MLKTILEQCGRLADARKPYVLATVVRVAGSASAKPGSKAVFDGDGRNVVGWVGGGCAEGLVREESLKALAERQTRIVRVDLEDEVLGIGMPCGGNMEVYLEPHFPARRVVIAGHGSLARHLGMLAGLLGYAVQVHGPEAQPEHFPTAESVERGPWETLAPQPGDAVLIAGEHATYPAILSRVVEAKPAFVGMVASRKVAEGLRAALAKDENWAGSPGVLHSPAGLDIGARTLEEISFSVVGELLAWDRHRSGLPLRDIRETHTGSGRRSASADSLGPPPPLLVIGQGRIVEEIARLGALAGRQVTVSATQADPADYPVSACLITGKPDLAALEIGPNTQVVIATLHKGDHLSTKHALEADAAYVGLIASPKRSNLVLEYVRNIGVPGKRVETVHAPAGLDLGALNPTEIAFSILAELVAVHRGGTCRPLVDVKDKPPSGIRCDSLL